jgi:MoxR-like ATPase
MEEQILGQVSKALENGDHVLLVGPPGTGKSKLARTICESVVDDDYEFVTATSDWSTFDTVGGYHPEKDESLVFKPGVFLNRFKNEQGNPQNEWLVIDEINRADIDKAFGALFSVLAGDNVTLSFTDESDQSIRVVCNGDPEQGTPNNVYYVPDDWRMVATMNTLDKTSLYEMSYAFMRRWAFVSVPVPEIPTDNDEAAELIADYVDVWRENGGDEERYPEIAELWRIVNKYREIGPAIIEDIYDHVENDPDPDYASAISMYIIPQMEGLRENQLNEFVEDLEGTEADADRVRNFAKDYFQADI